MADDEWGAAAADELSSMRIRESENKELPPSSHGGKPAVSSMGIKRGAARGGGRVVAPQLAPAPGGDGNDEAEKELSAEEASLLNKKLHSQLVTTAADIEVQHRDPKSPLYSVKSFEGLHLKPELLKGIYDMGFSFPSRIQEAALPALLADPPCNMIAQSQSGTGKTAAFVCCMLSQADPKLHYPQCLCLSPTYELALQTGEVIQRMAKFMPDMKIRMAVRGEHLEKGEKVEEHIIVGTPGTLLDWCTKFKAIDLSKIRVFVLDEADVMISQQGHQDQSVRLHRGLPKDCQMLLFSATYNDDVMKFAKRIISDANEIRLKREEESLNNIKQFYIRCHSNEQKFQALCNIYGTISIGQSMIFCRTKKTAEWLARSMVDEGHAVALLSGDLDVNQRQAVIYRFREGKEKVLITTNVSARGLDIEQVTVVVNFDLPTDKDNNEPDYETYLHRIGRTGRFGKNGLAINFVDGQHTMNLLNKIQQHFKKPIKELNADDADEIERSCN